MNIEDWKQSNSLNDYYYSQCGDAFNNKTLKVAQGDSGGLVVSATEFVNEYATDVYRFSAHQDMGFIDLNPEGVVFYDISNTIGVVYTDYAWMCNLYAYGIDDRLPYYQKNGESGGIFSVLSDLGYEFQSEEYEEDISPIHFGHYIETNDSNMTIDLFDF
ncbi:MAG: hypothetical protein OEY79_05160 [Anaplasmataceae bacterium]|nr:hypothetical protein [Anaplasmataceae bacterium]